jgi:hypothetical protein
MHFMKTLIFTIIDSITRHTIQYSTIQHTTHNTQHTIHNTQYNTIQYNTIQYNTIQYNTIAFI